MSATPIFPFFISSHSSISVDNISKTFNAIPIPKAKPTAAATDQPIALRYSVNSQTNEVVSSRIMSPYSISMVFMISCINSDESIRPSANEIAISELQEAMNVLNSPFETGTSTLTLIIPGIYALDNPICF